MTVPRSKACGDTTCFACYPLNYGVRYATTNDFFEKETEMTSAIAPAVTVAAKTKTVKEFTVSLDADTASKVYDVLTRHVAGHGLHAISNGLAAAGVDTYAKYKNNNKTGSSYGSYSLAFADLRPIA